MGKAVTLNGHALGKYPVAESEGHSHLGRKIAIGGGILGAAFGAFLGYQALTNDSPKNTAEEVQKALSNPKAQTQVVENPNNYKDKAIQSLNNSIKSESLPKASGKPALSDLAVVKDDGWIYPNEVDKNYDFSDPKQAALAWIEAFNNNDSEAFTNSTTFFSKAGHALTYLRYVVLKTDKEPENYKEFSRLYNGFFGKSTLTKEEFEKFSEMVDKYNRNWIKSRNDQRKHGIHYGPEEVKKFKILGTEEVPIDRFLYTKKYLKDLSRNWGEYGLEVSKVMAVGLNLDGEPTGLLALYGKNNDFMGIIY